MKVSELQKYPLVYLGTPYSRYDAGIEAAWIDACGLAAEILRSGVRVYSPIAHTHPIAVHGGIDPLDLSIWLPFDATMIAKSEAIVVAMMQGWEASSGIRLEMEAFVVAGKPVFFLNPETLEVDPLSGEERESILVAARGKLPRRDGNRFWGEHVTRMSAT